MGFRSELVSAKNQGGFFHWRRRDILEVGKKAGTFLVLQIC